MTGGGIAIAIEPFTTVRSRDGLLPGLDSVFFDSSATQSFTSDDARKSFRERWLGRYLTHYPNCAYVALDCDGRVAGYVLGSLEDPAATSLFDDIGYFKALAPLTQRFPAQLHVNVRADLRGTGLGSRLVACFNDMARAAGAPGVHIVTGRAMRNVGFYEKNGFREIGSFTWNGRELVILGLSLAL